MTGSTAEAAVEQLRSEIAESLDAIGRLGVHDADSTSAVFASQIDATAGVLGWQLAQDDDDRLAAQTVIDIMCWRWPDAAPEACGHADWWQTPVGRLCARSLGRVDADAVTHSVAAAMLGVTRGTISQWVHRGTLDRHPDGGVLRGSVLARLARPT